MHWTLKQIAGQIHDEHEDGMEMGLEGERETNKKLKWTYQKVVKMSLLNTSMFILLLLLALEYLFICALLLLPCEWRCVTFLAQEVDDNAKAMNFELWWWERWE